MNNATPHAAKKSIALLFDDAERLDHAGLVGELRAALQAHGAHIVHEGSLAQFDRDVLKQSGAQVLVVNLDDEDDDALDRLYEMLDGDGPRLIFNDAQASRNLKGWDRARWARHLAVKTLASGDLDPPRPADALPLDRAVSQASVKGETSIESPESTETFDDAHHKQVEAESIALAAELEVLLAADEFQFEHADEFRAAARLDDAKFDEALFDDTAAAAEPPPLYDRPLYDGPLYDGNFTTSAEAVSSPPPTTGNATVAEPKTFQLDHLSLLPLDAALALSPVANEAAAQVTRTNPVPASTADWALLDDAALAESAAAVAAIEKIDAAEYLAPHVEPGGESPVTPGIGLQLVSREQAIAPQDHQAAYEMQLDDLNSSALRRMVVLGAAAGSEDAVCDFLAALPAGLRLPMLLVQPFDGQPADERVLRLSLHSAWPVKLAASGMRVRAGEVLVMPPGAPLRLLRDGRLERASDGLGHTKPAHTKPADAKPTDADAAREPSIDATFVQLAGVFGRDLRAIVFAGCGEDAVADAAIIGARAVRERGGQVWIEQSVQEHDTHVADAMQVERLINFSGTPDQLAARLSELAPAPSQSMEHGR